MVAIYFSVLRPTLAQTILTPAVPILALWGVNAARNNS